MSRSSSAARGQPERPRHAPTDRLGEIRWDGITDLTAYGGHRLGFGESEVARKRHKVGRLTNSYRAILGGMQIATLFRLVEFRSDRECRLVPPESTEYVGCSAWLVTPARRHQVSEPASVEVG